MNIKKRQEVINLMPWYNLGKLSSDEKSLVEKALAEDPSLKDQLSLDQDIMAKVIADPKLLDKSAFASSAVRLDKVLAQIDGAVVQKIANKPEPAAKKERQSASMFAGIKSFFTDLLAGSSHSFTYAVFAALTVVQLALLMFFVVPSAMQNNHEGSSTASGEQTKYVDDATGSSTVNKNVSSLVLIIAMKDNIGIEGFTSKKFGEIKFDLLPDDYGYYRVRLNKEMSQKDIEVLKNELSHKTNNVTFVGEIQE